MLLAVLAGCHHGLRDEWDDLSLALRNRRYAARAWDRAEAIYGDLPHDDHFEEGFKAGYVAVAEGRDGCLPMLPPPEYWRADYQNPEGHRKTRAWFDGYTHGALAAEHDGIAHWNRIVLSHVPSSTDKRLHFEPGPPPHVPPLTPFPDSPELPLLVPAPAVEPEQAGMH